MLRVITVRRRSLNMSENGPKIIIAVSIRFPFVVGFSFWFSFVLLALWFIFLVLVFVLELLVLFVEVLFLLFPLLW